MFFNFEPNVFYTKVNSKKMLIIGIILLSVGLNCLLNKRNFGIAVFSWGISIATLYCTWLCFREYRELKRYADKNQIRKFAMITLTFLIISILLIFIPIYFNYALSIMLGIYILYKEISMYIKNENYYRISFGIGNLMKIIAGLVLIFSPLFFVRFLVNILSVLAIIFGAYLINWAIKNKDNY